MLRRSLPRRTREQILNVIAPAIDSNQDRPSSSPSSSTPRIIVVDEISAAVASTLRHFAVASPRWCVAVAAASLRRRRDASPSRLVAAGSPSHRLCIGVASMSSRRRVALASPSRRRRVDVTSPPRRRHGAVAIASPSRRRPVAAATPRRCVMWFRRRVAVAKISSPHHVCAPLIDLPKSTDSHRQTQVVASS